MSFESLADLKAIENEQPWEERDLPVTIFDMLTRTKEKFPNRPAVSYQIFSVKRPFDEPPDGSRYLQPEQSHALATRCFEELKRLTFPSTGLQPSPELG